MDPAQGGAGGADPVEGGEGSRVRGPDVMKGRRRPDWKLATEAEDGAAMAAVCNGG
jgi:hypothetical protein